MRKYKVVDLFGNEEERIITGAVAKNASKKSLFTDYEGFVDKFKPKKTTDDCYTPAEVYGAVLNYVKKYTEKFKNMSFDDYKNLPHNKKVDLKKIVDR